MNQEQLRAARRAAAQARREAAARGQQQQQQQQNSPPPNANQARGIRNDNRPPPQGGQSQWPPPGSGEEEFQQARRRVEEEEERLEGMPDPDSELQQELDAQAEIEEQYGGPTFVDSWATALTPPNHDYTTHLRPILTLELIYIAIFLVLVKILTIVLLKYFKKNIFTILKNV